MFMFFNMRRSHTRTRTHCLIRSILLLYACMRYIHAYSLSICRLMGALFARISSHTEFAKFRSFLFVIYFLLSHALYSIQSIPSILFFFLYERFHFYY